MDCFPPRIRRQIAQHGHDGLAATIELLHTRLLKYRQPTIYVNHVDTEEQVTIGHVFVLWQAHLHRAERLMVTCGSAIENNDAYGLAALIRAFVESAAITVSVRARLDDWAEKRIDYEAFDRVLMSSLLGSRSEHVPNAPPAVNILTHLKNADRFIASRLQIPEASPLSTSYGVLSEYAHPNMPSNVVAFSLQEVGVYQFQHNAKITPKQIDFLSMLATGAAVFEQVSASYHDLLTKGAAPDAGDVVSLVPNSRSRRDAEGEKP